MLLLQQDRQGIEDVVPAVSAKNKVKNVTNKM